MKEVAVQANVTGVVDSYEAADGVGAKKRPSVETEGRLTIACHMKSLKNRFSVLPCERSFFHLHHPCFVLIAVQI